MPVRVLICVPFRDTDPRQDRAAQLDTFVRHMPGEADAAFGAGEWHIMVAHQAHDGRLFARGRVLNAAFALAIARHPHATTVLLHDVDLLPSADRLRGAVTPPLQGGEIRALNTDSPWYATCAKYIGGVCAMSTATFTAANGFQNAFEGWGGEDDCLRDAVAAAFPDTHRITPWVEGAMGRLETAYRCAEDAATKMPKHKRREARAQAAASNYGNGLRHLVFDTFAVEGYDRGPVSHVGVNVHMGDDLQRRGWRTIVSATTGKPYFYHASTTAGTYDRPV